MLAMFKSDLFAKFMGGFLVGMLGVLAMNLAEDQPSSLSTAGAAAMVRDATP